MLSQLKSGKNLYLMISGYAYILFTCILLSVLSLGQYNSDTFTTTSVLSFNYFSYLILVIFIHFSAIVNNQGH